MERFDTRRAKALAIEKLPHDCESMRARIEALSIWLQTACERIDKLQRGNQELDTDG